LFFVLVILIVSLGIATIVNSQGNSVYSGTVRVGEAGYFEVASKARVDIDRYVGVSGQDLLVDATSKFPVVGGETAFTFAVQVDDLNVISFADGTQGFLNKTVFNLTTVEKQTFNGTYEIVERVNVSSVLVEGMVWSEVNYRIFEWDGKTWAGVDVSLKGQETMPFKFVLRTKRFGERVKYSYLFNTSSFYLEFDPTLGDGLVHYWDFEGNFEDIFGNKDFAIINTSIQFLSGAGGASALQGQYINFTRTANSLRVNDDVIDEFTDWSIGFWLQADDALSKQIFANWQTADDDGFFLTVNPPPAVNDFWTDIGVYDTIDELKQTLLNWTLLVVTKNSSNMKLYVNNTLVSTRTFGTIGVNLNFSILCGGFQDDLCTTSGADRAWNGRLDEAAMWNRTLDQDDIDFLYNNGTGNFCTGDPCSFAFVDRTPPTFNGTSNNGSDVRSGTNVSFGINWLEDINYLKTDFAHNDSGTLVIVATINDSGTSGTVNTTMIVSAGRGTFVCGQFNLTDAAGNQNQTTLGDTSLCFTVQNTPPTHDNPVLNSSLGTNFTNENLTCFNQNTFDGDDDNVTNIYTWFKNNAPLNNLYLPFEIDANDFSTSGNDGTRFGGNFVSGILGRGLEFNGTNDHVNITDADSLDFTNKKTWEIWFKRNALGLER